MMSCWLFSSRRRAQSCALSALISTTAVCGSSRGPIVSTMSTSGSSARLVSTSLRGASSLALIRYVAVSGPSGRGMLILLVRLCDLPRAGGRNEANAAGPLSARSMQRLLAAINVGSLASLISGVIAVILLRGLGQLSQLGLLLRQLRQLLLLLLLLGELLRIGGRHGIDGEGQHAAQLAGHAADGAADPRIAEQAADGAAQRLGDRADQIAEPALRRQLALLRLLLQLLYLLQLL